jgi:hypothetical protein
LHVRCHFFFHNLPRVAFDPSADSRRHDMAMISLLGNLASFPPLTLGVRRYSALAAGARGGFGLFTTRWTKFCT